MNRGVEVLAPVHETLRKAWIVHFKDRHFKDRHSGVAMHLEQSVKLPAHNMASGNKRNLLAARSYCFHKRKRRFTLSAADNVLH